MKSKVLIVTLWVIALIGAFSLKSNAQERDKCPSITAKSESELLADETTISYTKSDAKIETCNNAIFYKIYKRYEQLFKRYTCTWKKDRHGRYKQYIIYLDKDNAEEVKKWAKTNL